jgi:phthalate 4,5-dioxygenase
MITAEQNAFLTRTNAGTPMGELFRRYWIPALMSSELAEADGPQVRVKLLGEELIAFRDTQGRLALVGEFCPHRGASLWFGRNEEGGLRCAYHGWKFDHTGQCTEVPSEPAGSTLCQRIKIKTYPLVEKGGVLWTYMGPQAARPPMPEFEWMRLPADHRFITRRFQESNYLQAVEGGIDSSHVSFLHRYDLNSDPLHRNTDGAKFTHNTRTSFDVHEMAGGLLIGAKRDADPGRNYWRVSQWLMPWYTLIPPYKGNALNGHAWVPVDDETCIAWSWTFHPTRTLTDMEISVMRAGGGVHVDLIPGSCRPVANRSNGYLLDRQAQKDKRTFSGVRSLAIQDASVQESMGPIADRTKEHLVSTDKAIVMARARLREAAEALRTSQTQPPGVDPASHHVRSASFVIPDSQPFKETALDATKMRFGEPFVAV